MTPRVRNGLLVAAIHLAIVGTLGGKLLADRAMRPRAWARAAPVDPDLPIRGRYVSMRLHAAMAEGLELPRERVERLPNGRSFTLPPESVPVSLGVRNHQLIALRGEPHSTVRATLAAHGGEHVARLEEPVAYFIPEHARDPSVRAAGEELWVEVTIPRRGAPRPIRLGIRKQGILTPLDVH